MKQNDFLELRGIDALILEILYNTPFPQTAQQVRCKLQYGSIVLRIRPSYNKVRRSLEYMQKLGLVGMKKIGPGTKEIYLWYVEPKSKDKCMSKFVATVHDWDEAKP